MVHGTAKAELRSYVERIERLEEEKADLAGDIRSVYQEAKAAGFDTKALRAVIRLRKIDADERREQQALIETYMAALGMLADTPLGEAALRKVKAPKKAATEDPPSVGKREPMPGEIGPMVP